MVVALDIALRTVCLVQTSTQRASQEATDVWEPHCHPGQWEFYRGLTEFVIYLSGNTLRLATVSRDIPPALVVAEKLFQHWGLALPPARRQ